MTREDIIAVIGSIARKHQDAIAGHLSLGSLGVGASLGLSMLRSRLEALAGTALPIFGVGMTVDDLCDLLLNPFTNLDVATRVTASPTSMSPSVRGVPVLSLVPPANMGLGLDMLEIDSLPETMSYRDHPFYNSHFLPNEIATAMLRVNPRATLCGLFCAKEAAKKSHPLLTDLRMTELVVTHSGGGRPSLNLASEVLRPLQFQFMVSITHTDRFAAATCITYWSNE